MHLEHQPAEVASEEAAQKNANGQRNSSSKDQLQLQKVYKGQVKKKRHAMHSAASGSTRKTRPYVKSDTHEVGVLKAKDKHQTALPPSLGRLRSMVNKEFVYLVAFVAALVIQMRLLVRWYMY